MIQDIRNKYHLEERNYIYIKELDELLKDTQVEILDELSKLMMMKLTPTLFEKVCEVVDKHMKIIWTCDCGFTTIKYEQVLKHRCGQGENE